MPVANRVLVLRQRPEGLVKDTDFDLVTEAVPALEDGEAMLRVEWLGIDATVRTWLNRGEGYLPAVELGEVVRSSGLGRVEASRNDRFPVGCLVATLSGWQERCTIRDDGLTTPLPAETDALAFLALYGATGLTAYVGVVDVGAAKAGETVVVSAAAGATGSLAVQIAKALGCRVIGICGSDEKCAWLVDDLGIDGAVNYHTEDVGQRLRELCPDRVDVFFDNVGGDVLDAVLASIGLHGRVVLCGAIANYNRHGRPPGPGNYVNLIARRGRMEGFLSIDCWDRFPEVAAKLAAWVDEGKLRYRTHIFEGLESAPRALNAMFTGENIGKIVVRLIPPAG